MQNFHKMGLFHVFQAAQFSAFQVLGHRLNIFRILMMLDFFGEVLKADYSVAFGKSVFDAAFQFSNIARPGIGKKDMNGGGSNSSPADVFGGRIFIQEIMG